MARKMSVCLLDDIFDKLPEDWAMRFLFENEDTGQVRKHRFAGDQRSNAGVKSSVEMPCGPQPIINVQAKRLEMRTK